MEISEVDRQSGITRESFADSYLAERKPVVFTDLIDHWPAKDKWTIDYFRDEYGHLEVPVFSPKVSEGGKNYMGPEKKIPFREYLDTISEGPTELRMFLFNIFRHAPELCNDIKELEIMDGFINNYPFMFFGGQGSYVALHYDIDLSHVFLNQIHGRKRVVLFPPEQSKYLYHHPFTVASYVDVNSPDYKKYPALKHVKGYETIIYPGETLFMPSGFWHYIEYLDGGYSISLRANDSYVRRVKGLFNIARHYVVDRGMNKIMGKSWKKMKEEMAKKRAENAVMS